MLAMQFTMRVEKCFPPRDKGQLLELARSADPALVELFGPPMLAVDFTFSVLRQRYG